MSTHSTPKTLNSMWARAARRACVLAPSATRLAVAVVPMFSPITSAIPKYIGSTPVEHSRMVMAMTAADDCTMQVMRVPMARNARMVR